MTLTVQAVEELFQPLISGDAMSFFAQHVDENVVWTIGTPGKKTCILSGRYEGIHPTAAALAQLAPFFTPESPARTSLERVLISGDDTAVVVLSTKGTSTAGYDLHDRAAWICKIVDGKLKEVVNFCDTGAIRQLVEA